MYTSRGSAGDDQVGLKSMTGFASGSFEAGGVRYTCTARSVNRKGLDLSVRLPSDLQALEPMVRHLASVVLVRGDVFLVVEREAPIPGLVVDEEAARQVIEALRRVALAVGATPDIPVSAVVAFPEVVRQRPPTPPDPEAAHAILDGISRILRALDEARLREGEAIERDIRAHLAQVCEAWAAIRAAIPLVQEALREKAKTRLQELLAATALGGNHASLEAALAALADRMDVSEEVARMEAHLDQFAAVLEGPPPHGRRLDFLCQEMMREAGTLGAKAQSAATSHLVVSVKTALERIREQLANVV